MYPLSLAIALGAVGVFAFVLATFVRDFKAATGSLWERLLASAEDSATKLWAKALVLVSTAAGSLVFATDYVNDPQLSAMIKAALPPELLPIFGIVAAVVTIWARNRTLPKS